MDTAHLRSWTVILQPGDVLDCVPGEWADTLLVVHRGELVVECGSGRRAIFCAGAVLTIATVPVRRLHNPRSEPLVLQALARRRQHR